MLSFTNNKEYIFIVRRLGKQSKLILSRLDSISNLELNLRIHGPCGPDAHAGADLQVFLIFCFKPILLSAHKLILLIYGDNRTHKQMNNLRILNQELNRRWSLDTYSSDSYPSWYKMKRGRQVRLFSDPPPRTLPTLKIQVETSLRLLLQLD